MKYLENKELIVLLGGYVCVTIYLLLRDSIYYVNIINPLFWACILLHLIWEIKKGYIRFYINWKDYVCLFVVLCLNLFIFTITGFICGFAKSPYNHSLDSILKNIIIQIIPTIGIEFVRGVVLSRNKNNKIVIFIITTLLILIDIKYNIFINNLSNKELIFQYVCGTILPLIFSNVLYTYLSLKVSYLISLFLRLSIELLTILLPILPNSDWFVKGSLGVIVPIIIYVLVKYKFIKENKNHRRENAISSKKSYIITIFLCINITCFMLGVFKYEPITILSNSMVPEFVRGDVVIYKKLHDNELNEIQKNSIIIYKIGEQNIAHRVINIIENDGVILYQTKGDSNNTPDFNLVKREQIKGLCIFRIKYIGFPSVWLYEFFNS